MAVINKEIAYMALPLSIRRGNPFPIDEYSVWYDQTQMETYAQTSPVAYVGQIVTLVNESASTVEAYMIQNAAGNLVKLASTTTSGDLTADVQALQGKVSNLETAVGTKGGESEIVATNLWAAIEEVVAAYKAADTAIDNKFANYYNKTETDGKIDEKIASKISSTYKAAGSIEFASLPELSATEEGKVYNIIDKFTTTENFVEGAGHAYPIGTNVVCVNTDSAGTYKWDVLAGFVDTSNLATKTELSEGLKNKVDKVVGSSLVQDTLIAKLTSLAEIKGVTENELAIAPGTGLLGVIAIDQSKVTGLSTALEGKVSAETGKSLVADTLIEKLTGLAGIKSVSSDFTLGGDGALTLNNIAVSKVTGLTDALAEKIQEVKLNGVALPDEEGSVNIPLAGAATAGTVVGSNAENKIKVHTDGSMEVNSLNISKLVQTPGDELILNGGTANNSVD